MASPKNKKARELLKELLSLAELLPTTNRSGLCFVAVVSVAFPFRVCVNKGSSSFLKNLGNN
jgi:hypothetical protein